MKRVTITHRPSGELIAEGPVGWGITPFEGNWYIGKRYLKTRRFRTNGLPGVCVYKFLYLWLDFDGRDRRSKRLGWRYVLPNPLLPFIAFRIAVPGGHPELEIAVREDPTAGSSA